MGHRLYTSDMHSALNLAPPPSLATLLESGPVALFLDFDGTLVELAEGPDAISPLPDLAARLSDLSARLEGRCAIVSGRGIDDIEKHLGPINVAAAGSHGSDIRSGEGEALGSGPQGLPREIEEQLRAFAAAQGIDYEHKPHGGALHYRRDPSRGEEAHAFAQELAAKHGWLAQSGKCVVELIAKGADKGSAVAIFMETAAFAGARPVFIGDDLTDEAGFKASQQLSGLGILVGDRDPSRADYKLAGVAAVHQWLEL